MANRKKSSKRFKAPTELPIPADPVAFLLSEATTLTGIARSAKNPKQHKIAAAFIAVAKAAVAEADKLAHG